MNRLAIITTHPIQYNAPFFRALAQSGKVALKVFYTWDKGYGKKHDPGFGEQVEWDIPLLEGYEYTFVKNTSKTPGSHHFFGIQNPSLIDEIKNYRPNAILVYGWSFRSHLQVMRYFKGNIPIWFRGDSTLLDYDYRSLKDLINVLKQNRLSQYLVLSTQYFKFLLRRMFLTWIYKHIDKAFYVGTNNKQYYLAHGVKENQLIRLPHSVNNEFFQKDEENTEVRAKQWRRELGINDEDFVVLFAGKFEPKKNPELLVKAVIEMNEEEVSSPQSLVHGQQETDDEIIQNTTFSNLQIYKSANHPIHLILAGSGILEPKLKEMADGKDYIHFLPFQNQSKMPVVYRLGNVFCLPSKGPGETWGLAVNEAMACGRTVIVSDKVGCAVDLVLNGITGFIFQHNSLSDLMKKINALQSTNIKELGNNCLNFIKKWNYKTNCLMEQFSDYQS